jgi:tetratricopeptide (TPR) repeat protein
VYQDSQFSAAHAMAAPFGAPGATPRPDLHIDMQKELQSAFTYHQHGHLDQAERIYQSILDDDPGNADALHLLGVIALQQGNPSRSVELISRAIRRNPRVAAYHANRADAYRMLGQHARAAESARAALGLEPWLSAPGNTLALSLQALGLIQAAVDVFREVVRHHPEFAAAHNNLAMALHSQGEISQAIEHFQRAVALCPTLGEARCNLGRLLFEQGRLAESLVQCREAVRLRPNLPEAHMNLGRVLCELGQTPEAKSCYAEALRQNPDLAVACNDMGRIVQQEGKLEESLAWYRRSLELKPDFAQAHCNVGIVMVEQGRFEQAHHCFRTALHHAPDYAEAQFQLAALLGAGLPRSDLAVLRQLLAEPAANSSDDARSALHGALALVLDARGDHDGAAEQMRHANAFSQADWTRRGLAYDPAAHEQLVASLIETFNPDFFNRVRGFGVDSARPVFIVGLPRSGTTLTEQVLASHSQVFGSGELSLVSELIESLPEIMSTDAPAVACLARLDRATAQHLARRYLEQLDGWNATAVRVVDKMPENYLYLGLLAALFPRARFIHCRRDLRDVAVSCWMTHFSHVRWAAEFDHIARRIHSYLGMMNHWRQVLPASWLDVSYEETVADLEPVARRLVAWCGLEWEPACLAFHENHRPVRSASLIQARQPVYTHAVGRWKHYERTLAPLLERVQGLAGGAAGGSDR